MANLPDDIGVPTVNPEDRMPDDYQRIQSSPNAFGGAIAQGGEKLGQGIVDYTKFWDQVQTDHTLNQLLPQLDKNLTDFRMLPDNERLAKQADFEKQQEDTINTYRGQLRTPIQLEDYEKSSRAYVQRLTQIAQSSIIDAAKSTATKTNADAMTLAENNGATYFNQPDMVDSEVGNYTHAFIKAQQIQGVDTPESRQLAYQTANQKVRGGAIINMAANDPNGAMAYLEKYKGVMGDEYGRLHAYVETKQKQQGGEQGFSEELKKTNSGGAIPAPRGRGADFESAYTGHLANGDVSSALRLGEGLKTTPYMDKSPGHPELDHWAIGYGMHQIQRADGSWEEVTPFTKITPAEAEHNLQVQTQRYANIAKESVGPAWDNLPKPTQAALTSISYNYGVVPKDIAAAAMSGDNNALAQAIANHAKDNQGINASRRYAEANAVLGKAGTYTAGVATAPSPYQIGSIGVNQEGFQTQAPLPQTEEEKAVVAAQASDPLGPPVTNPVSAPQQKLDAILATIDRLEASGASENLIEAGRKQAAIAELEVRNYEAEVKKKVGAANDVYWKQALTGNVPSNIYDAIAKDHAYDEDPEARQAIARAVRAWTGEKGPSYLGKDFNTVLKRMSLPKDDPDHIEDKAELIKLFGAGEIDVTSQGLEMIDKAMESTGQRADINYRMVVAKGLAEDAKARLSFDQTQLAEGLKPISDPVGKDLFENKWQVDFWKKFSDLATEAKRTGDTKDLDNFLTKEMVDRTTSALRDPKEMALEKMRASINAGNVPDEASNAVLPKAPWDVNEENWNRIVQNVPKSIDKSTGQLKPWPHDTWAGKIEQLRAHPTPENIKAFDRYFAPKIAKDGWNAESILSALGRPQGPEGVVGTGPKEDELAPVFNTTMGVTP